MVTITVPTDDDWVELSNFDARAFGLTATDETRARDRPVIDLERFRIARADDGQLVGVAGSYAFELTLPGGAAVPMSGLTWVAVAPTHRRQGILRHLLDEIHEDGTTRGEPVAGLTASEGGIYERFGYGVATRFRSIAIDRRTTTFTAEVEPGTVRLVDPTAHIDDFLERWDRYRRTRAGELSRSREYMAKLVNETTGVVAGCLHDDGYAFWTMTQDWNDGLPAHSVAVQDFCAVTPEAHAAIWQLILSIDLVGPVSSWRAMAVEDALPYLLANPRSVCTTVLGDNTWIRIADPVAVFGTRAYRVADSLVIDIDDDRYRIDQDGCVRTDEVADLTMTQATAGSLLLGAVSATELARGRRLTARTPDTLHRADAFFGWSPLAHNTTPF